MIEADQVGGYPDWLKDGFPVPIFVQHDAPAGAESKRGTGGT